jgi:hypothetical protein
MKESEDAGRKTFSVFVSHSMRDAVHVAKVERQLDALGIKAWLAEHDPQPGTSILEKIERVMPTCDAVLFLITTNSIDSAYVQQEIGMARTHALPMVPLVDSRVDTSRLGLLGELEWIKVDLDDSVGAFEVVTRSLQPLLVRQALVAAQNTGLTAHSAGWEETRGTLLPRLSAPSTQRWSSS